ncbi:MAG TPA: M28 family peptidase [Candidatus Aquicultor sp.]|jgi:hypothetical protein
MSQKKSSYCRALDNVTGARRLQLLALLGMVFAALIGGCAQERVSNRTASITTERQAQSTTNKQSATSEASATTTTFAPTATTAETKPIPFDTDRVMVDVKAITAFGIRAEGSKNERAAAAFAESKFKSMGYAVTRQPFTLPPGKPCQNLIVDIPGAKSPGKILLIGGHIDSRPTTLGANDDALGVAIVLELARIFKQQAPPVTLRLMVFGAEEYGNKALDQHHLGSRYYVKQLSANEINKIAGMISVDMVGYGSQFRARSLGKGPKTVCNMLINQAKLLGVDMVYEKAPEWSDHEPFEKAGIPSVWFCCETDPVYHTMGDITSHLVLKRVSFSGDMLVNTIRDFR